MTRQRTIEIRDFAYQRLKDIAKKENKSLTDVLVDVVSGFIKKEKETLEKDRDKDA